MSVSMFYDAVFSDDELAFRDEVDELVSSMPDLDRFQCFTGRGGRSRELYRTLGERGWLRQCWPETVGGAGRPISYEFLLWDTLAERRAARPDIGPGMIAHTIVAHGSDDQHGRFLPGLGDGSLACALGYSEPGAGSDLTHLRTRAVRRGDSYVVDGHKIWTSDAHHASRLWLLCRTGEADSGRNGLTLLFVDLASEGVEVTPIPMMDRHQVNEVFLDGVVVPVVDRIGVEGGAWTMIREALAVERHTQVLPGRIRRDLADLRAELDAAGRSGDPVVEAAYEQLVDRLVMVEAASLATLDQMLQGGDGVIPAARAKLLGAELCQEVPRVGLELLGADGVTGGGDMAFLWRQSVSETIAGGSVEVMLSLLARNDLALGSRR